MAALVAGVQYGLTSHGQFNENKSLIFVKLTDSAIRAIEEYLKNKNKCCNQTPTIQFLGNEGHLSLPSGPSVRGRAGFKFSLSSNADIEGPQGSFECIQHTGQRCLESVGSLPCKMRVQANEDVYETTKSRMQAAEKQQKENCTREIELDKAGLGRRIKVRSKMVNGISRKPTIPAVPAQPTHTPLHTTTSHTKPQGNNYAQKPGNPELIKRPIRDRIIHLLAVRPYRKPELMLALSRDGLREKDRNKLMNTIMTVATLNKDNTFSLMRHVWSDVQEDWPFYSEQDKNMLKRRKPENLTPPGSSDSASPNSVHPGSPPSASEPISAKRPGYYDGADGVVTKRQRISHYRKPTPPQTHLTPPPSESTPPSRDPSKDTQGHLSPPTPPMDTSPPSAPPPPAKYPPDYPKYLIDYTTIKDVDQRRKYKEDFNANYNEYRQLHSVVEKVSRRFSLLEEKLKREERGSEGWQRIKDQILKEYSENKRNTKHQDAKRRFQYLHEKLSHIKRLVVDYDSKKS